MSDTLCICRTDVISANSCLYIFVFPTCGLMNNSRENNYKQTSKVVKEKNFELKKDISTKFKKHTSNQICPVVDLILVAAELLENYLVQRKSKVNATRAGEEGVRAVRTNTHAFTLDTAQLI